VLSEELPQRESHASLDNLFMYAGAPGDPPEGSKPVKVQSWLRRINEDQAVDALAILGRLIEQYMEFQPGWDEDRNARSEAFKIQIEAVLVRAGFQYYHGGRITTGLKSPSKTLEALIKEHAVQAIDTEFERALANVSTDPREAASAACNILESICKVYIEEEGLALPPKQDLQGVWGVVRKHLGLDPSSLADDDLKAILSGLIATAGGIGALRTHASSAHGAGKKTYKLEPRHARLAIHAAHTLGSFILETWEARRAAKG
jgi:hypothetical protein